MALGIRFRRHLGQREAWRVRSAHNPRKGLWKTVATDVLDDEQAAERIMVSITEGRRKADRKWVDGQTTRAARPDAGDELTYSFEHIQQTLQKADLSYRGPATREDRRNAELSTLMRTLAESQRRPGLLRQLAQELRGCTELEHAGAHYRAMGDGVRAAAAASADSPSLRQTS